MPELRQNIVLKEWVIYSTERAKRPDQLKEEKNQLDNVPEYEKICPFCPGNEEVTGNTTTLYQVRDDNGWLTRVVPNKFPALEDKYMNNIFIDTKGIFRKMDGVGNHDVIIETPQHNLTIANMEHSDVKRVLETYKKRIISLLRMPYVETIICFRNNGTRAGASIQHPHSQMIALPIIPKDIMLRINESIRYHEEHRECIFCTMLKAEQDCGKRVVMDTPNFTAFVPYAAYTPFCIWIFPKRHSPVFEDITNNEIDDLANVLKTVLYKLYKGLNNPDYNYIIRSAPKGYGDATFFHWYVTIVPRLTKTAGFELGTGTFINPTLPEDNAEYLRSIE